MQSLADSNIAAFTRRFSVLVYGINLLIDITILKITDFIIISYSQSGFIENDYRTFIFFNDMI